MDSGRGGKKLRRKKTGGIGKRGGRNSGGSRGQGRKKKIKLPGSQSDGFSAQNDKKQSGGAPGTRPSAESNHGSKLCHWFVKFNNCRDGDSCKNIHRK